MTTLGGAVVYPGGGTLCGCGASLGGAPWGWEIHVGGGPCTTRLVKCGGPCWKLNQYNYFNSYPLLKCLMLNASQNLQIWYEIKVFLQGENTIAAELINRETIPHILTDYQELFHLVFLLWICVFLLCV